MSTVLHDDELPIDVGLVRRLVDRAFPAYSALELLAFASSGSSNALFRLGDDLLVRLPRQPGGSATIDKEARWLPMIGALLPVAVPEVVAVGGPDLGYPERWSVVRWLTDQVATVPDPCVAPDPGETGLAEDLAAVVTALRGIDVPAAAHDDASLRSYRGDALATMDATTRENLDKCRSIADLDLDLEAAGRVWGDAMALPGSREQVEPRWYHGDLLAENLLVREGRLTAVLDFGGLAIGDPTIDLVVAWEVLDAVGRERFRAAVGASGVDDESWRRGRAWALAIAVMTFPYYWRTMPGRCADRLVMARAVLADAANDTQG